MELAVENEEDIVGKQKKSFSHTLLVYLTSQVIKTAGHQHCRLIPPCFGMAPFRGSLKHLVISIFSSFTKYCKRIVLGTY